MKKFLLVLSCCLATWCSVLAGPKSSPEISLMQASAPAATNYPAVINSAYHDPDNHVIVVNCDQNNSGSLAFFRELGGTRPEIYRDKNSSIGKGKTVEIPLEREWELAEGITILISVGDGVNICGGRYVKLKHPNPDAKISKISYIPASKKVRVEYSIINPKSDLCYIRVTKDRLNGQEIVPKTNISSSSTVFEIPSSKFTKGALYCVEISVGSSVKRSQNYIFDNVRSGYMGAVSVNDYNVTFNYTMKNASDPYIAIKQGSKYGPVVKKIQITNTNGDYKEKSLYYPSVLKEKTTYVADLFDGSEDLRIFSEEFTIPEKEPVIIEPLCFEWHFDEGANQIKVWCTRAPSSSVYIEVYNCNNGVQGSIQGHASGNSKDVHSISIPRATAKGQGYIIHVSSGSEKKSLQVYIANHLNK